MKTTNLTKNICLQLYTSPSYLAIHHGGWTGCKSFDTYGGLWS
jgi:hypothetical protein